MDLSIIYQDNRSGERIRVAKRNNLILDKSIKQFSIVRSLMHIPSNISIQRICRKNKPSFRAFGRPNINARTTYRCSTILAIFCALICSCLIDKHKLFSDIPWFSIANIDGLELAGKVLMKTWKNDLKSGKWGCAFQFGLVSTIFC